MYMYIYECVAYERGGREKMIISPAVETSHSALFCMVLVSQDSHVLFVEQAAQEKTFEQCQKQFLLAQRSEMRGRVRDASKLGF